MRSTRLEDRIAELEAAVSRTPDDWEPDGSEDQAQHRPDKIVYRNPELAKRRTSRRISRITLQDAAPDEPASAKESRPEAKTTQAPMSSSEIKAVVREEAQQALNKPSSFDAALKDAVDESLGEGQPAPTPEAAPQPRQAEARAAQTPEAAPQPRQAEARRTPTPQAAPQPRQPEAREAPNPAQQEKPPASEGPAAQQQMAPPVPGPKARHAETQPQQPDRGQPATPLNEETLRPIVRQLLREELQGEMGERITRNVRKLVRQEIQRALAAIDVE